MFYISIPGAPVGAGRPRAVYIKALGRARVHQPDKSSAWKATAAAAMRARWDRAPLDVPVLLVAQLIAARPKSLLRKKDPPGRMWRTTKPDVDNALKLVMDALVDAGVLRDDTFVASVVADSLYARKDEGPSVQVWLERCPAFPGAWGTLPEIERDQLAGAQSPPSREEDADTPRSRAPRQLVLGSGVARGAP